MVCIAEPTGNNFEEFPLRAFEMKLIDLIYGNIQSGSGNYLNTDSTFWILLGPVESCYEPMWLGTSGNQFVMAPTYNELQLDEFTNVNGYSLYWCNHDVFAIESPLPQPLLRSDSFVPDFSPFFIGDTDVFIHQLPDLVHNCATCLDNLVLNSPHTFSSYYTANSTLVSTAEVDASIFYTAKDRITLNAGFKTNPDKWFRIRMEDCD